MQYTNLEVQAIANFIEDYSFQLVRGDLFKHLAGHEKDVQREKKKMLDKIKRKSLNYLKS